MHVLRQELLTRVYRVHRVWDIVIDRDLDAWDSLLPRLRRGVLVTALSSRLVTFRGAVLLLLLRLGLLPLLFFLQAAGLFFFGGGLSLALDHS